MWIEHVGTPSIGCRESGCIAVQSRSSAFVHQALLDIEWFVCRMHRGHPVTSCFAKCDRLTRPLCSSPITGPSSLIRVGPSQCSASVLSPRGFGHLGFLPSHRSDWFLQFRAIACIRFTPSPRRPPPAQSSGIQQVYPRKASHLWF